MPDSIMTTCGVIRGTTCQWDNVVAYKGIRYATAGRWEYPQMVTHWDGVYEAKEYGNCCYQPRAFYNEEEVIEKVFYYNEFRKGATYTYDDDCLFMNIWTPEGAGEESNLPVIFYIHGGGFKGGCAHEKHFDGPIWPIKGVIAVTFNYRLGPMGFICLPELEAEAGHTGNYGMFDQIVALEWVKKNIKAFGGNPDNITIMGQSAGAMSVTNLCLSPLTDGLFAKAVMNSGGGVHKMMDSGATTKDRYEFWEKVMAEAGCVNLAELRALEADKLFAAFEKLRKSSPKYGMIAAPCVDGICLLASNMTETNKGSAKKIPYMMGSTSEDMMPPFMNMMAKDWCVRHGGYAWYFDRQLPGDENGAWHSSELWYFFGTLENCWRPFTEHDYKLSDAMSTALCNFARTGNPNEPGTELWKQTSKEQKQMMIWGEEMPHMGKPSAFKMWKTMLTKKNVGE